jgi:hypothetical protein
MSPVLAALPVWPRILGANLNPADGVMISEDDLLTIEGDLSNIQIRNDRYYVMVLSSLPRIIPENCIFLIISDYFSFLI